MARRRGRKDGGSSGTVESPRGTLHRPPPQSFSPSLEAERQAGIRGLADLREDLAREGRWERKDLRTEKRLTRRDARRQRGDIRRDLGYAREDIGRDLSRGREDIALERRDLDINFARDLYDLAQAGQRGEEDYARAVAGLTRSYGRLAEAHADQQAAAGLSRGGAAADAAQKRAANQAFERQDIDTSNQRRMQDIAQQEQRARENYGLDVGRLDTAGIRLEEDASRGLGRTEQEARLGLKRTGQDLHSRLRDLRIAGNRGKRERHIEEQRAIREQGFSDVALTEEQIFQARQLHPGVYSKYGRRTKGRKG